MDRRMEAFHKKLRSWFAAMARALDGLSEAERCELREWEEENLGPPNDLATSDWPGWRRYIGEKPVYADPIRAMIFLQTVQVEAHRIGA